MDLQEAALLYITGLVDRSRWGSGAWDEEPDFVYWLDPRTRYRCIIVRHDTGYLCGYVGVAKDHPAFGMEQSQAEDLFEVHGGVTFSESEWFVRRLDASIGPEHRILNTVYPTDAEPTRWLGFDCNHLYDITPSEAGLEYGDDGAYRTLQYVVEQCTCFAKQLHGMAGVVQESSSVTVVLFGKRKIRVRRE